MAGTALRAMRREVLDRLRVTDCCTHLNDGLRSLAEVPILAAIAPGLNRRTEHRHGSDVDSAEVAPASRTGRPRRFEAEDELRILLDAAFVVMERNGYADAAVADILREADLSTRSFYRHFESKDQLLCALFRREAEAAAARLCGQGRCGGLTHGQHSTRGSTRSCASAITGQRRHASASWARPAP